MGDRKKVRANLDMKGVAAIIFVFLFIYLLIEFERLWLEYDTGFLEYKSGGLLKLLPFFLDVNQASSMSSRCFLIVVKKTFSLIWKPCVLSGGV